MASTMEMVPAISEKNGALLDFPTLVNDTGGAGPEKQHTDLAPT